jgi:epoxyqueuosine reductase
MIAADAIKERARAIGFDLCGVAPAAALPELARLRDWLDQGYAGEMIYLHKSADTRADIRRFLPSARSVIVTGTVYYTEAPAAGDVEVARYAWGEDYHIVLAERLDALVSWMRSQDAGPFESAIFVDKHHVQERVFAKYAGLGWIGKNTCLINPEAGSWLFLAGIATSLELPSDAPLADRCGQCTLCIDSCPTGALVDAYEMDATRCLSYLTIEVKGPIPEDQRSGLGHHVYGCDICQDVCPWNLAPLASLDPAWAPRAGRHAARAAELWQRSDAELNAFIRGSAMTRTTVSRLRRNLAVALGNSGDPAMVSVLERPGRGVRRAAPSAETPLVQEHARWATAELKRSPPEAMRSVREGEGGGPSGGPDCRPTTN